MAKRFLLQLCVGLMAAGFGASGWCAYKSESPVPKTPPLPPIRVLKIEPASLVLEDGRDTRKVLILGETDAKTTVDLTSQAVLRGDPAIVSIDADGYIHPVRKGKTEVTIAAAGKEAKISVTVLDATAPPVHFVREIEPILSKVGCNAGTCHGAAKGKNGFKLSLRGYDPQFDYQSLINDLSGRRFNRVVVDESLMLLKPTAEVPHEGRQAIKPGSRYYQLLRQWIAEGAPFEDAEKNRAAKLEVFPQEIELDLPGRTQQLLVLAHYSDGKARDVTREVVFSSSNIEVAEAKDGKVTGLRRGEAAVLIRYEGNYATKLVTIMGDRTGFAWNNPPEYNYVDRHIYAKLKKVKTLPSELCTDAEFIRRVSLDLTGLPPTPDQVKAFLADRTPGKAKRERLIDELLESEDFVDYWANKWADLLQCNSEALGEKGIWLFRDWIRGAIAENKPYDRFVRDLLLAEGSSFENPAVNYYRVLREPGKITEDVSQTFLGVRFNCNKCHDHPFEKWTQDQYYQFGAYFARVAIKRGTLGKDVIRNATGDPITVAGEEIVYRQYEGGEVKHPKTGMEVAPKVPFGQTEAIGGELERRESFVQWLTSKDNPLFAKAMANRVWSYFFSRGIIDPVDDIRASNPPSNPELLEALTTDFIKSGLDVKHLMRAICRSRAYQLSIQSNKWNADDTINFSHARPRRLSAEQLLDAVGLVTGSRPQFPGLPLGLRAVELPDGMVAGSEFLTLFGRPKRQSACECERTSNVTLAHALSLINGKMISEALHNPTNRLAKIVEAEANDKKVVEEVYYAVLNRPPTEQELSAVDFSVGASRLEVAQDLAWALINSPAFLFNR